MDEQYKKLIDMISYIVANIYDLDKLSESLLAMADRHVNYGVKNEHYQIVGDALLWTLQKGLGSDWNDEVAQAWTKCYTMIANTMTRSEVTNK